MSQGVEGIFLAQLLIQILAPCYLWMQLSNRYTKVNALALDMNKAENCINNTSKGNLYSKMIAIGCILLYKTCCVCWRHKHINQWQPVIEMIYGDLCSLVLMAVPSLLSCYLLTYTNVVVCHQIKLYNAGETKTKLKTFLFIIH